MWSIGDSNQIAKHNGGSLNGNLLFETLRWRSGGGERLIAAADNLKHQTALALAYATGLLVNEVANLRVSDIESQGLFLTFFKGCAGCCLS